MSVDWDRDWDWLDTFCLVGLVIACGLLLIVILYGQPMPADRL